MDLRSYVRLMKQVGLTRETPFPKQMYRKEYIDSTR